MLIFIIGLIIGIIIGTNIEFLRNISSLRYFSRDRKTSSPGKIELFEIKLKLFVLRLYEEKKVHFLVIFYCFLVSFLVFSFTAVSHSSQEKGYLDRFLHIMEKINRSIEMDWGR